MAVRKRVYIDFRQEPGAVLCALTTNAIATAADNQVDHCRTKKGYYLEHIQTGANTALQYITALAGWTIPCDGTDGDGVEITNGILAGRDLSFTVGTDPAFYVAFGYLVDTIAAQDVYGGGFRKQGAYVDITTPSLMNTVYDDKAALYVMDAAGDWRTTTSIGGTDTQTDITSTACANATYVYQKVKISAAGAVTFELGQSTTSYAAAKAAAAAPAGAVAATLTSGIILTPYFALVSTGTLADVDLIEWDAGYQQA
jgi:hypothetical protein